MSNQNDYIKQIQKNIDKYRDKISKIDKLLENYNSSNKSELLKQQKSLKGKFAEGEEMLEKIKSASEEEYDQIKEKVSEVFEGVKEAFQEFSSFLTMEQLYNAKDELVDFSNEKLDEVQNFIKNRPLTIAAWAMGIGFLFGALFTRSK